MLRPTLLLLAAVLVAQPAATAAAPVDHKVFRTPSGRVECHAVRYGGPALECSSPDIPELGELDSYFLLRARGRTVYAERGDYDGYVARREVLRYGQTWRRSGVTCRLRTSGLSCRNRDGHGFHLARGAARRF